MATKTGSLDLRAAKKAHESASKTATNYIYADSNGIKIANSNPSTATTYQLQTASSTEFVVGGTSMAEFGGSGARIGDAQGEHLDMDSNGVSIKNGNSVLGKFTESGVEFLDGAATLTSEYTETQYTDFERHRTSIELQNTSVDFQKAGVRAWSYEDVDDGAMQGTAIGEAVAQLVAGDSEGNVAALVGVDSVGNLAILGEYMSVTYPVWDTSADEFVPVTVDVSVQGLASVLQGGVVLHSGSYSSFVSSAVSLAVGGTPVNVSDFSRLIVEYEDSTGRRGSVVVDDPEDGVTFTMQTIGGNSSAGMVTRFKTSQISISSQSSQINTQKDSYNRYTYGKVTVSTAGTTTFASTEEIAIVKVIGFY